MDVTRKNFLSLLPDLENALSEADFIAVDLEFTGLTSCKKDMEGMPFDTPSQYYGKVYKRALDFLPLQLGISIFKHDSKKNRYNGQAYNFYVFPSSKLRGFPNTTFQSQCSSVTFLSSSGFDFNKAFGEGISFLTQEDEDKLRMNIEERQQKMGRENSKDTADVPVPDDMKTNLQINLKKIKDFLDDSSETAQDFFILDRCNGFMRKLLYQEVPKEFGDAAQLETCDDSAFAMKVFRGGGEELKKLREEEKKKAEWKEFEEAVGISSFIKMISESGKLVVGHNCLLDVCHLVNRFRYPLPSNYENFKELVHHIFPRIIDTKFMASVFKDLISSSVLVHLKATLSEPPFEMPVVEGNMETQSHDLTDNYHDGAFDSYVTGLCFLSMCHYLAKNEGRKFHGIDSIKDLLSNIENRLHIMKVQDVPIIRLGAPDTKPPRNHVFHLKFPREWRQYDIVELFKPFGPIFIHFIDDKSAFVALHRKDQAKAVMKTMTKSEKYKITPFGAYQNQIDRKSPPVGLPASPSLGVLGKRKSGGATDTADSTDKYKKHCNLEQPPTPPKHSIDPIPEESETGISLSHGICTMASLKEFAENESWS